MKLDTRRFSLRTLDKGAVPKEYYSWIQDPLITRYLEIYSRHYQEIDAEKYIESHDKRSIFLLEYTQKMENLLAPTHSKARVERRSFRSGD